MEAEGDLAVVHLVALAAHVRVRSDAGAAEHVRQAFGPLVRPVWKAAVSAEFELRDTGRGWSLSNDRVVWPPAPLDQQLEVLATEVNALALHGYGAVAVHAAVVALAGRAVALPAVSGAGKSTLTAACLRSGLEYVSDEALCLRWDGSVEPYPKPLSLSAWSRAALAIKSAPQSAGGDKGLVSLCELGGRVASEPLTLVAVAFPARCSSPGTPAGLEPVHRADALTGLLSLAFNHYKWPGETVRLLSRLLLETQPLRLRYRNAEDGAALLASLLEIEDASDRV